MAINLVKLISNVGAVNVKQAISVGVIRTLGKHAGRDRITIPKEEIQNLPDFIKRLAEGLENPTVFIGRNSSKGKSLWGLSVRDGERPVANYALSVDTARNGSKTRPIWQYREQIYSGEKKIYSTTEKYDTSQVIGDTTEFSSSIRKGGERMSVETEAGSAYAESIALDKAGYEELVKRGIKTNSLQKAEEGFEKTLDRNCVMQEMKDIRRVTSPKTSVFWKMNSMDLQTIEAQMSKYQARIQKLEKELDELYTQALGRDAQYVEKESEFIFAKYAADRIVPKVNPKTGEKIPKELREKIMWKNRQYATDKFILHNLNIRKMNMGGYGQTLKLDEKYAADVVKRYNIKPQKISKTTARQLRQLRGLPKGEIILKAKDILAKEYGIPAEMVEVKMMSPELMKNNPITPFMYTKASNSIQYNPNILQYFDDDVIISLIGHELQHAKDNINFAKQVGLKSFQHIYGNPSNDTFNLQLWEQILKNPKPRKFDSEYLYSELNYESLSADNYYRNIRNYYASAGEGRGYQRGFDVNFAISESKQPEQIPAMLDLLRVKIATNICERLDKLKAIRGDKFNEETYFAQLQKRAISRMRNFSEADAIFKVEEIMIKIIDEDLGKYAVYNAPKSNLLKDFIRWEKDGMRAMEDLLRSFLPV